MRLIGTDRICISKHVSSGQRFAQVTLFVFRRDFIREVARVDLLARWKRTHPDFLDPTHPEPEGFYFVMNLPDLALEFLDVFPGLLQGVNPEGFPHFKLPRVFCYCFVKGENKEQFAREKAEGILGSRLGDDAVIRTVRNVSPNKHMMRVNFTLSRETLFGTSGEEVVEPEAKSEPKPAEAEPPEKRVKKQ